MPTPWDSTYETTPAQVTTDQVANGGPEIASTRSGARARIGTETKFGTSAVNLGSDIVGTSDDTGRLWVGACRPFYQVVVPGSLPNVDAQGSNSLDSARCWVDLTVNSGGVSRRRFMVFDAGLATWLEVGANCGAIPRQIRVTGITHSFFTANTWTDVLGSHLSVATPTIFNGGQYTLVVEGQIAYGSPATSTQDVYAAIATNNTNTNANNLEEAKFTFVGGGSGFTATTTMTVRAQLSTGAGTLAANTPYSFYLLGLATGGASRGWGSASGDDTTSLTHGVCFLRAYLYNASEA